MKSNVIYLVLFLILLTSCGKKDSPAPATSAAICGSMPYYGSWLDSSTDDTMYIFSDCTGIGTTCAYTFTIAPVGSDTATVDIHQSNMLGSCLSVGKHSCGIAISDRTMALECGNGTFTYQKLNR